MTIICPKCGHQRTSSDDPDISDTQCPACGIYYFKYLNQKSGGPTAEVQRKISNAPSPIKLRLVWLMPIAIKFKKIVASVWRFIYLKMTPKRLFWLIIISFFSWQVNKLQTNVNDPDYQKAYQARQALDKANCKKDLSCWAGKYESKIIGPCTRLIEKNAKYSAKWSEDWGPKIRQYRWQGKGTTSITYIGDKVQFQNGFGAWQNMIYECDFNPETDTLFGVRVFPGKL